MNGYQEGALKLIARARRLGGEGLHDRLKSQRVVLQVRGHYQLLSSGKLAAEN